jgi:hypothetical protein
MEEEKYLQIDLNVYYLQDDDTLYQIMAHYSGSNQNICPQYKLAYDLLQLRYNQRLVKKTWWLTMATWVVAILTLIGNLIVVYLSNKC